MPLDNAITDVPGIKVGQADDYEALTGCSVVLCERGAVGGVDVRGGAPGTRETDLLRPLHLVQRVHAVLLAGGSAFGLEAATGVVRYLEEKRIGFDTRVVRVPIVPAAILFDLGLGRSNVRPDATMGYEACRRASTDRPAEGNVGAGMGASVGKIFGTAGAMKAGIGTASLDLGGGVIVGALVAVNSLGDVVDPADGRILAGVRPVGRGPLRLGGAGPFADTMKMMRSVPGRTILRLASRANTVIGVVATNARLTKEQVNFVAQMAHDGVARAIRPAHTLLDGDCLFALSTGPKASDVNLVGAHAAEVVTQAILRATLAAHGAGGLPAARDLAPARRTASRAGRREA
ncbi:MAG TPA: P1 family peptidase [Anaerolineales bacterium]|nr:P1 family peptidase [Anaerolineales bacterium]